MITVFAASSTVVLSQDPPKEDPSKAPQEEKEEPPAKVNWITFGTNGWDYSGNQNKFRQYASVPGSYSINELRLLSRAEGTLPFARFTMRGSVWDDSNAEAMLTFDRGRGSLKGGYAKADFRDSSQYPVRPSRERNYSALASYAITPQIGAFWSYEARDNENYIEDPKSPYRNRSKSFSGGIEGKVLGGQAGVTWVDRRFYDRTDLAPDSVQRQFHAHYGVDLAPGLNVGGAYSAVKIGLRGFNDNEIKNWAFSANWDVGPDTTLLLDSRRTDFKLRQVENSYVQEQFVSNVRLVHQFPGLAFQFGYQRKESERVRTDQKYVDVPKWDTLDARISTRVSPSIRLVAKGSWEHLEDRPAVQTADARSLFWDDRLKAQVKLDGGNDRFSGYAVYAYQFDQNSGRDVEIATHNFTLGGSYIFNDKASGYLEYANETYEARGVVEDGLSLDDFFPSNVSIALGFDYALRPNESFSVALNHYFARYNNPLQLPEANTRGTEITATYSRQISPNSSLKVVFAPWQYKDRVVRLFNYRATALGVNYTVKF